MKIKYTMPLFLLISVLFLNSGCSGESTSEVTAQPEEPVEPVKEINLATLITKEPENLASYSATIWGQVTDDGGTSIIERGVCFGLETKPNYDGNKTIASTVKGSGEFEVNLSNLAEGNEYYARSYAKNAKGIAYGNEIQFTTTFADPPIFSVGEKRVSGAHDIFIAIRLDEPGDTELKEIGVVYGLEQNPTLEDKIIKRENLDASFTERIRDLKENTFYFIRPYTKTSKRVVYGEEVLVKTINEGKFTYSFNGFDAANENHVRIKDAFDTATQYYNNFTSITKHVVVNYSPGTPTADANFAGNIRVGSNAGYQRTGTAMHEMAHTVGVGQHRKWNELIKAGIYQGAEANAILKMMTNDPNATVKGDGVHFWPYGVNGAHEDNGKEMTYIIHALIIQGMKADGLPSN
ncbi:hypothetical protein [Leeuwenhoekiella sp. W20_SRS_FM14]|uniref:hypothetical protein n=1 Tax=Leeuwenhoekiella sp. W20_SRS_FM14 TaxID=3240270 RepID=UPI003F9935FB